MEEEKELFDDEIYILTDEEGKESQFSLLGSCRFDGNIYLALVPVDDKSDEYVILKSEIDENGEETLVTIEDDEEFFKVADMFEDELFSEEQKDADQAQKSGKK